MINADLHSHSLASDGTLAPAAVAKLARGGGVKLWSLTDHDTLNGQHEAQKAAQLLGMHYIPGVEISVTWADRTIHIVGLNIDFKCESLIKNLAAMRVGRTIRAHAIAQALEKIGVSDAFNGAMAYVSNPELISRTHFARLLIKRGLASSIQEVFMHYLVEGKPAYIKHHWTTLKEAVGWIKSAGGTAVIAHPGRYAFNEFQFSALFDEFKSLGGEAIEVVTGSHKPQQYRQYANIALHYGFRASRGTDFHSPKESRGRLGKLPPLPENLTPVWADWL